MHKGGVGNLGSTVLVNGAVEWGHDVASLRCLVFGTVKQLQTRYSNILNTAMLRELIKASIPVGGTIGRLSSIMITGVE